MTQSSLIDRITGRFKKAAGDLLGDRALRSEGVREERKAEAKEELARQEEELERQAARVADLERRPGAGPPR
jgi:uncharacterized protein YjbJ (UPF0337 family)